MRIIETKIYKFDELTDKAKDKARDWFRDCQMQSFGGHGELWEPAETAAKLLGIEFNQNQVPLMGGSTRTEPNIMYSGFSSQGDGASFTGSYSYAKNSAKQIRSEFGEDKKLWRIADDLADIQKRYGYKLTATITQGGQYVHKYTMSVEASLENEKEVEGSDADAVLDLMRDFAQWIYDGLKTEWEYQNSDEAVDESIAANEYEFTEDGKIV